MCVCVWVGECEPVSWELGGGVILACHIEFNVEHQTKEMDAQRECLIEILKIFWLIPHLELNCVIN